MKSWILLLSAATVRGLVCPNVSVCSAEEVPSSCSTHDSLPSALSALERSGSFELTVMSSAAQCEERIAAIVLEATASIRAAGLRLMLAGVIEIAAQVKVTVQNCTLAMAAADSGEFRVLGKLWVADCEISAWSRDAFGSVGGEIRILRSVARNNTAEALVAGTGAVVELIDSEFVENEGGIVTCIVEEGRAVEITIQNCTLSRNAGTSLIQVGSSLLAPSARVTVSQSEFSHNAAVLLDLSLRGGTVRVENCTGVYNLAGGFRVSGSVDSMYVSRLVWSHNDYPLLWIVSAFKGAVSISETEISFNRKAAAIHIKNTSPSDTCQVSITNSAISHLYVEPAFPTAGVVLASFCTVVFSHSTVRNCTYSSQKLEDAYAVFFAIFSNLEIRNTTIAQSGGSGFIISYLQSKGVFEGVAIIDAEVGSNTLVAVVGSAAFFRSISIQGGRYYSVEILKYTTLFAVVSEMADVVLSNITMRHNPTRLSAVIAYHSNVNIHTMTLFNVTGNYILAQTASNILIDNLSCELSAFIFAMRSVGVSESYVQNSVIHSTKFFSGFFVNGINAILHLSSLTIRDTVSQYLAVAGFSTLTCEKVSISDSVMDMMLSGMLQSNVSLQKVTVWNVRGTLVAAVGSLITIVNSTFAGIRTEREFAWMDNSVLVIVNSQLHEISVNCLVSLSKASRLVISDAQVFRVQSTMESLIHAKDSEVEIHHTAISALPSNAIYGLRTSISINSSLIEEIGFNNRFNTVALYHFGGAVACIDCPVVNITFTEIRRTSADLGGAVYAASEEQQSTILVDSSTFEDCWAHAGGVMYLQNVSFSLTQSTFKDSNAEESGGALDIDIRSDLLRRVAYCTFLNNSALEGGAVKWRSVRPTIISCSFVNNTAIYGPDVASYGTQVAALEVAEPLVSGQPTHLCFVLLDHYRQMAVLEKSSVLVLKQNGDLSYGGIINKVVQAGYFNFTSTIIYAPPNSTQTFLALFEDSDFLYTQNVTFRECELGEIKSANSCTPCLSGHYSLNTSDTRCSVCPEFALCPGGSVISPIPGAWRTNSTEQPVMKCMIESACEGSASNTCAEGYEGMLCGHCKSGWFSLVFSTCRKCPHPAFIWAELAIVAVAGAVFVRAICKLKETDEKKLSSLKALVVHLQLVGMLAFFRHETSIELEVFFHLALSISTLGTLSLPLQCVGSDYLSNAIATSLLYPCLLIAVALVQVKRYKKSTSGPSLRGGIADSIVTLSSFAPTIALIAILPLLQCVTVADKYEILAIDTAIVCWEGNHKRAVTYLAAFSLTVNVLVPVAVHQCAKWRERRSGQVLWICRDLVNLLTNLFVCVSFLLQIQLSPSSQIFIPLFFLIFSSAFNSLIVCFDHKLSVAQEQFSTFILIGTYSMLPYYLEYNSGSASYFLSGLTIAGNITLILTCIYSAVKSGESGTLRAAAEASSLAPERGDRESQDVLFAPNNSGVSLQGIFLAVD